MRGKGFDPKNINDYLRITPAYAGKSSCSVLHKIAARDHPRLCGEKLLRSGLMSKAKRITPAYAGKSYSPQH